MDNVFWNETLHLEHVSYVFAPFGPTPLMQYRELIISLVLLPAAGEYVRTRLKIHFFTHPETHLMVSKP